MYINHLFLRIMASNNTSGSSVNTFIGYSAVQGLGPIYNINLVNQDLLNQINTRKGEKVMDPEFGSIVWDLIFENKSPSIVADIQTDLTRIVNSDPRVTLQEIDVIEQDHGYVGIILLWYNQFATAGSLQVSFNSATQTAGQNTTGS